MESHARSEGSCPPNMPHLSILSPSTKLNLQWTPSPRMGGLQANSGGVSRVGALPLPQVPRPLRQGERPRARYSSKNRRPEAVSVSLLKLPEAQAASGPVYHSNPAGQSQAGALVHVVSLAPIR